MDEQRNEPASYSPTSAINAATTLWNDMQATYHVPLLVEICTVILTLAELSECPNNMSVVDLRLERLNRENST